MTKPENNSSTNVMKPEKKKKMLLEPVGFRFSYKALNRSCSVILPPKLHYFFLLQKCIYLNSFNI